jgi:hypothetical protein
MTEESPEQKKQRVLDLDRDLQIAEDRRQLADARARVEAQQEYDRVFKDLFGFGPREHEPEAHGFQPSEPLSVEAMRKRIFGPNAIRSDDE